MTDEDAYVLRVVAAKVAHAPPNATTQGLVQSLTQWAGQYLNGIELSGSHAKNTAVAGSTDLDLLVSLNQSVYVSGQTLLTIYNNLEKWLQNARYGTRRQNVSIRIQMGTHSIDIVPAVKHLGNTNDHSLYLNKQNTWTKTNVQTHIQQVANSGRTNDIRAVKIWRDVHGLEFPSFYLELAVLKALYGRPLIAPAENFRTVMRYLSQSLAVDIFQDPANTNNRISNDLTAAQKKYIAQQAGQSLLAPTWNIIVW